MSMLDFVLRHRTWVILALALIIIVPMLVITHNRYILLQPKYQRFVDEQFFVEKPRIVAVLFSYQRWEKTHVVP